MVKPLTQSAAFTRLRRIAPLQLGRTVHFAIFAEVGSRLRRRTLCIPLCWRKLDAAMLVALWLSVAGAAHGAGGSIAHVGAPGGSGNSECTSEPILPTHWDTRGWPRSARGWGCRMPHARSRVDRPRARPVWSPATSRRGPGRLGGASRGLTTGGRPPMANSHFYGRAQRHRPAG